jgi:hypothetical protein
MDTIASPTAGAGQDQRRTPQRQISACPIADDESTIAAAAA